VILENGVIRTMDASLPTARALAIAGDRVAGGVGTHETALASPDVVDLGGRCVLPGSPTRTSTFPSWAVARRQVRLEGAASLDEALDRVRDGVADSTPGRWLRGQGWRDADWAEPPTKEALDAVTGDVPAALLAKDYHSLWLNSAALALANGDLAGRRAGSSSSTRAASRPACSARSRPGASRRTYSSTPTTSTWTRCARAEGRRLARRHAIHDKDGWLPAIPRLWQELEREGR
jgi:predicted amidohydrolase YtcJ